MTQIKTETLTEDKRKRRSFWQPDAPELIEWIDNQTDLGTSLQLIIVDAIQQYGKGDAILSYLGQRINGSGLEPAIKSAPTHSSIAPQERISVPVTSDTETGKVEPTPKLKAESVEPNTTAPVYVPELPSKPDIDEGQADTAALFEPRRDEQPSIQDEQEEQPAYDPIAILMADSGSRLSK